VRPPRTTTTPPSRDRRTPVRPAVRDSAATPSAVLDLQRLAGNQATRQLLGAPPPLADMVLRSGGTPLPADVRAAMEQRFGEDLGDVRVHAGARAADAAEHLNAHAFAFGSHMVFGPGAFDPVTSPGRTLLAHEVAHVIQQRRGGSLPDPHGRGGLERSADRSAGMFAASGGPVHVEGASAPTLALQEKADSGDPPLLILQPLANVRTYTVDGVLVFSALAPIGVDLPKFGTFRNGKRLVIGVFGDPRVVLESFQKAHDELVAKGWDPDIHNMLGVNATPKPDPKPESKKKPPPKKPAKKPAKKPDEKPPELPPLPEPELAPAAIETAEVTIEASADNPDLPPLPKAEPTTDPTPSAAEPPPPPPPKVDEQIDAHTSYLMLDEDALGKDLLGNAKSGNAAHVQQVLDKLDTWNRDDVSLAFAKAAKEDDLKRLARTEAGRRLLDRLFDELTEGEVSEEEQEEANRILKIKTAAIMTGEQYQAAVERAAQTIILPYRKPGITVMTPSPIYASRMANGHIWVKVRTDIYGTEYFKDKDLRLPPGIWSGIELKETDAVGVKFYDDARIDFFPAMYLLQINNEGTRVALHKMGEAVALGLTAGTLGLGGEAAVTASELSTGGKVLYYGGRALTVLDHAALALDVVNSIMQEHRGWIIEIGGEDGRIFVQDFDKVNSYAQWYGLARGATGLAKLAWALRGSFKRWRAAARAMESGMSDTDKAALVKVEQATENMLQEIDNAAAPAAGDAHASSPVTSEAPGTIADPTPSGATPIPPKRPAYIEGVPNHQQDPRLKSAPTGKLRAVPDEGLPSEPPSTEPQSAAVPQEQQIDKAVGYPITEVTPTANAGRPAQPQAVKSGSGGGKKPPEKPATVISIQPKLDAKQSAPAKPAAPHIERSQSVKAAGKKGSATGKSGDSATGSPLKPKAAAPEAPKRTGEPPAKITTDPEAVKPVKLEPPRIFPQEEAINRLLKDSHMSPRQQDYMKEIIEEIDHRDLPLPIEEIDEFKRALAATDEAGRWRRLQAVDRKLELRTSHATETYSGSLFSEVDDIDMAVRVENAQMASNTGTERVGTLHGQEYARDTLGLRESKWINPFETYRSRFGIGFDDIMLGENGEIWIMEYKGGKSTLSKGQMEDGWVIRNIEKLEKVKDPAGLHMAKKLREALEAGKLRGVALKTPIRGRTPKPTFVIGEWNYKPTAK